MTNASERVAIFIDGSNFYHSVKSLFFTAINRVRKLEKRVENAFFSVSSSSFLKQACNSSILLDILVKEILEKKK